MRRLIGRLAWFVIGGGGLVVVVMLSEMARRNNPEWLKLMASLDGLGRATGLGMAVTSAVVLIVVVGLPLVVVNAICGRGFRRLVWLLLGAATLPVAILAWTAPAQTVAAYDQFAEMVQQFGWRPVIYQVRHGETPPFFWLLASPMLIVPAMLLFLVPLRRK